MAWARLTQERRAGGLSADLTCREGSLSGRGTGPVPRGLCLPARGYLREVHCSLMSASSGKNVPFSVPFAVK